ncbi:MAG: hypothetical protein WDN06_02400 [Asticcacaulis sp.]
MSFDKPENPPLEAAMASRKLPYDQTVLVLQGGGALGAYQAGVYEVVCARRDGARLGRRHLDRRHQCRPDRRQRARRPCRRLARFLGHPRHRLPRRKPDARPGGRPNSATASSAG